MRVFKEILKLVLLTLGYFSPRNKRKIVFSAWNGDGYSDNPKFLFEYFFNDSRWTLVWIGSEDLRNAIPLLPHHATFCKRGSIKSIWHALTARTWVFSHSTADITILPIWGRAFLLDTNHGIALKQVGVSCRSTTKNYEDRMLSRLEKIRQMLFKRKIFLVVPSVIQGNNTIRDFPGLFQEPALPFGSPSIDYIIKNKENVLLKMRLRQKFAKEFKLPIEKKWIVYAPTFRWSNTLNFSFFDLKGRERESLLNVITGLGGVIVEKLHPKVIREGTHENESAIFSIAGRAAKNIDPYELWLVSDIVISDYSGALIAFYFQGKPIIHFVYDYDFYVKQDTGLVFPLNEIKFGQVVYNINELCVALKKCETIPCEVGIKATSLIEYEDGHACERYLHAICQKHGLNVEQKER